MRATGNIQRAAGQTFVHRQHKPKTVDPALIAQRQPQRLAQRQPGIFHGVVIVNIEVAANVNFKTEAAVGGDLIEHMIEEADAGVDFAAAFAIQPDFDIHLGLFGVALNVGIAVAASQLFADSRPVQRLAIIAQASNAHVIRQLDVGGAIADNVAVSFIHDAFFQPRQDQLGFRLTAFAVVSRQMRTNQHVVETDALGREHLHHQIVRAVKLRLRQTVGPQTVLIGDHHQFVTFLLQFQQGRDHLRLKGQLFKAVYLKINRWLGNQRTVTVNKEKLLGHTFSAVKASITRWLSARVPIVIRKQPLNEGCLFWSRKIMP